MELKEILQTKTSLQELSDYDQIRVDIENNSVGDLKGYDCEKCKNKGYIVFLDNGHEYTKQCDCIAIRSSMKLIKASGLGKVLEKYSFDNYITDEEWQGYIKEKALDYLNEKEKWFFISGQVGAGKSHICTAIVKNFLDNNIPVKYMLWKSESVRLKSCVNEMEQFDRIIKPLKEAEVLYIDDFFKGGSVTVGDINIAFEIINYRYNEDKKTIISSEKSISELLKIDEAIGSRIKEMSRDYILEIGHDRKKNYRLR